MISLLGSRSDRSPKRAVSIAGDTVTVYHWAQGGLTESFAFEANEAGLGHFSRYLRESPTMVTYPMVDIVEEEYRPETILPLRGSDRQAVIRRKQARLFRGTPYCYTLRQGREAGGRRDERLLFTAIVNPGILLPWIQLCLQHKTPIAGIYSLPILSQALLPKIGANARNVLLVTLQSTSGLRQSYFLDQGLKLSRLAKLPRPGTAPFGPYLLGELERLQRYLNNLGLMAPAPLHIYILSHGELLETLEGQCRGAEGVHYYLLDVAEVARLFGIQGMLTTPYSDYLFAHLLLQTSPKNHYGSGQERKYFKLHQTRAGLLSASLALGLGSFLWSGFNFMEGLYLKEQSSEAEQKTNFYQARLSIGQQRLKTTPVDPFDIKTAVEMVDTLSKYKATPLDMMRTISRSLDRFENLHLAEIQWIASTDPSSAIGGVSDAQEAASTSGKFSETEALYRYYQIALVKGYIKPFNGNYREAIATLDRFAQSLRSQAAVREVNIVTLPLNIGPGTSLQGSADEQPTGEAEFVLKVVLGIGNATG
jgi:hypothetical protein